MDAYQQYIHKSRYARYLPEEQRRETWEETIDRYLNFWIEKGRLTLEEANGIFSDIHNLDVKVRLLTVTT
jgi:ribonucleoside-diphosphate reductase alpha chain